ncbi:helix-turn-helix transcriptional regulator [Xiamenia xianingshaonis]|nr:helix-turn-helix transcriptional regulator [Xiamenia xianingshaonis]
MLMDTDLQKRLGTRLRELRKERTGLSQEKFAHEISADRTYYASIEQGRHAASITMLSKIAKGLGMTLEELFKGL